MATNENRELTPEEYKAAQHKRCLELIKQDCPSLDDEVIEKLYAKHMEIQKSFFIHFNITKEEEDRLFAGFEKVEFKPSDFPKMTKEEAIRQADNEVQSLRYSLLYAIYLFVMGLKSGKSIKDIAKEFNTNEDTITSILEIYEAFKIINNNNEHGSE
ncbi:MAG: helix-turn-helix domain-containing protein [Muribaculaceae bacterium]|nr:helix-turn-helix domain-containing protein [Muribaculaceae bacterium]